MQTGRYTYAYIYQEYIYRTSKQLFLRETVVNRTYSTHKNRYIALFLLFNNIWSYLLWSPVIPGLEHELGLSLISVVQ